MESTLVSARVPRAKKERASGVLESLGATTSDLINSAFDFVIEAKRLPIAEKAETPSVESFEAFVAATTLDIDWPENFDGDYKQLMSTLRNERYEALDRH